MIYVEEEEIERGEIRSGGRQGGERRACRFVAPRVVSIRSGRKAGYMIYARDREARVSV